MARTSGPRFVRRTGGGNIVSGRQGGTYLKMSLRGADDLVRALARLDSAMSDAHLAQATLAGADVLADEWRQRVVSTVGYGPGVAHYAEAIDAQASPGKKGATALVYLKDVPLSEGESQPRDYASRLEFGSGATNKKLLKRGIIRQGRVRGHSPTLRPAFDAVADKMVDAMADELRSLIEGAT